MDPLSGLSQCLAGQGPLGALVGAVLVFAVNYYRTKTVLPTVTPAPVVPPPPAPAPPSPDTPLRDAVLAIVAAILANRPKPVAEVLPWGDDLEPGAALELLNKVAAKK